MIDMHCHLDLYKNPILLLPEIQKRCKYVLAVTTSPRAWEKAKQVFTGIECIKVALGLHPEILSSKVNEIDMLLSNIRYCKYIGEVGIDGSARYKTSFLMQKELFKEVLLTAEKYGGRIISIHSRNAIKDVLAIIDRYMTSSTAILHWFSGTIEEVQHAIALGCWFSVSPSMLASNKGRSIVSKIPLSRILPETDAPFTEKRGVPYMPWEAMDIIDTLKNIFCIDSEIIKKIIFSNLKMLIGL